MDIELLSLFVQSFYIFPCKYNAIYSKMGAKIVSLPLIFDLISHI